MKTHIKTTKNKIVGQETLVRASTGEVIPAMIVAEGQEKDFNFHKIWLEHLIQSVDGIVNKKLKLAFWIIDNLDKENKLVATQRKIAEKTGMSLFTVTETMKALQEGDMPFLKKINSGAYLVNPDIIWKGNTGPRMAVVYEFDKMTSQQPEDDEPKEPPKDPEIENQVTMEDIA